jgi:hypothetical protein
VDPRAGLDDFENENTLEGNLKNNVLILGFSCYEVIGISSLLIFDVGV